MKSPPAPILTPNPANLQSAADLLAAGKLVVLPTETVYGIALNLLSPEARTAARAFQQIPAGESGPAWVLHLADPKDALAWVPSITPLGKRLLLRALPGPVAFQIKLTPADLAAARAARLGQAAAETLITPPQDPTLKPQDPRPKTQAPKPQDFFLTLRVPDCPPTQQILQAAASQGAIPAIIGAGTRTHPAVFEVSDLPPELTSPPAATEGPGGGGGQRGVGGGQGGGGDGREEGGDGRGEGGVAAIIDAGASRYRKSSTLVRIDGHSFSILRPGVIDERIIQKMADFQIVFVCTGNTCRSPMAAALASRILADGLGIAPSELPLRHILVQSAGLHATRGQRAAREAIEVLAPFKTDIAGHISQPMTTDILRRADVIYTMTDAHREELLEQFPGAASKTYRLDPQEDVEDPIGAGLTVYQEVADRLTELLKKRLSELPL